MLNAGQVDGNPVVRKLEEDEESIESLVCSVLTPLQKLVKHLETPEVSHLSSDCLCRSSY